MASTLSEWTDKRVCVITCDGRSIWGQLTGYDQLQNLILQQAEERVYSVDAPVEVVPLGLYLIRGDNVVLISHVSEEDETWKTVQAQPLNPVIQNVL